VVTSLYYSGDEFLLSLSAPNGLKINNFPSIKVSDNLVKVLSKKQVNTNKIQLSNVEQALLQRLSNRSDAELGVSKQKLIKDDTQSMIGMLKNDLVLVTGELDANNDNPELKDRLSEILRQLVITGGISRATALKISKEYIGNV
jgi:hypothetical protein